jgi:hypothetical protein
MIFARVFLITGLALAAVACGKSGDAASGGTGNEAAVKTASVTARSGLRLRREATLRADVVTLIPFGTRVEIVSEQGELFTVEGKNGRWTKVRHGGVDGWAFGGFLAPSAPGTPVGPDPQYELIAGRKVGLIELGKPVPEAALDVYKTPDSFNQPSGGIDSGSMLWSGKMLVKLHDGKNPNNVFSVYVMDPVFRTASGIGVGSAFDELKKLFPKGRREEDLLGMHAFLYALPGIIFGVNEDRVTSVMILTN